MNDLFVSGLGFGIGQLEDPEGLRKLFQPFVVNRSEDWRHADLSFDGPEGPTQVFMLDSGQPHLLVRSVDTSATFSPIWDLLFRVSKGHRLGISCSTDSTIICGLVAAEPEWELGEIAVTHTVDCVNAAEMHARFVEFQLAGTRGAIPEWAIPEPSAPFDAVADALNDHLLPPLVPVEIVNEILSSVDDVDWNSVNDAYGTSGQTPELLRLWLSDDQRHWERCTTTNLNDAVGDTISERSEAIMFTACFHQGTLYDASAPVATVLIEVARLHPNLDFRLEALHTLGHCMANNADAFEANQFPEHDHPKPEVWRAAAAGWKLYLSLLDPGEPIAIRRLAARLLPWIGKHPIVRDKVIDELNNHSGEDPVLDSLLLLALGTAAHGDTSAETIARAMTEENELVSFSAKVALARMGMLDRERDGELIEQLALFEKKKGGQISEWRYFSAHEGDIDAIARDALTRIEAGHTDIVQTEADSVNNPPEP